MSDSEKFNRSLAVETFENSCHLLADARTLRDVESCPRSYALAVLSAEEYTKTITYLSKSVGFQFLQEEPEIGEHAFRKRRITLLLLMPRIMSFESWKLFAQLSNSPPKREPDRDQWKHLIEIFKDADSKKESAFYVNDEDGKIRTPTNSISKEEVDEMIEVVGNVLSDGKFLIERKGEQLKSDLAMRYFPLFTMPEDSQELTILKKDVLGVIKRKYLYPKVQTKREDNT